MGFSRFSFVITIKVFVKDFCFFLSQDPIVLSEAGQILASPIKVTAVIANKMHTEENMVVFLTNVNFMKDLLYMASYISHDDESGCMHVLVLSCSFFQL